MRTRTPTPLLIAATTALLLPSAVHSETGLDELVRVLLAEHSEFETFPDDIAAVMPNLVLPLSGALSAERESSLREAVLEEFSADAMRDDVVRALVESGDPGTVSDLLAWLPAGAVAELDRVRMDYEPPLTLEEYAQGLEQNPPARPRVVAMAACAQTQRAALFYVGMQEAQMAAAHTIAQALSEDAPTFTPLTDAEVDQALQTFFGVSTVTFLWTLEPASTELIQRATAEYGSESGQWFVTSYSLAIEEAIDRAAERLAEHVAG